MSDNKKTESETVQNSEKTKKWKINFEQVLAKGERQEALASEPEITAIPVRSPKSDEFFRCDPRSEYSIALNILTLKDEQEEYLIYDDVIESIGYETAVKRKSVFVCNTMNNSIFVSTIPLPDEQGKLNQWHKSAYATMERAKKEWIRRQADRVNNQYTIQVAKAGICPDPKWTGKSLEEVLEMAFEDFLIDSMDHAVLKRLGH